MLRRSPQAQTHAVSMTCSSVFPSFVFDLAAAIRRRSPTSGAYLEGSSESLAEVLRGTETVQLRYLGDRRINSGESVSGSFEPGPQMPRSRGKACRLLKDATENGGSVAANGRNLAKRQTAFEVRFHKAPGLLESKRKEDR